MKNLYTSVLIALLLIGSLKTFAQVPVFNSYPSASAVIFLDFDGHSFSGTSWNLGGYVNCGPSGLSNTAIQQVFNRVAEDYRPFNINITTDSTRYWSAPAKQRMRVVLTITSEWYGNVGGVAKIGSFTWGDNTPCFVFTKNQSYNVKYIAESASHEAGHTFGLRHQSEYDATCKKVSDYHYGTGSGEVGWAPIMGVGFYKNFTLWHNGQNAQGCTVYQNDLEVIRSKIYDTGLRIDDHTDDAASATKATFVDTTFTVNGIVAQSDDRDVFQFSVEKNGAFRLDAIPYNVGSGNSGSNLDMSVELLNSSQKVLGSYNPGALLSSIIDTNLNAGKYFLVVEGKGNQFAPEYGSLGSYSLQGRFSPSVTLPLRKLVLSGTSENGVNKLTWLIDADEAVVRQVVEASTDGRTFKTVAQVEAADRTFIHTPSSAGSIQYRISVTFDNGRQHYSNNIGILNKSVKKPQLYSTVISGNTVLVSSPSTYHYLITDYSGRLVLQGSLSKGSSSIDAKTLAAGMYVIRFNNGQEQFVEKFVKQ